MISRLLIFIFSYSKKQLLFPKLLFLIMLHPTSFISEIDWNPYLLLIKSLQFLIENLIVSMKLFFTTQLRVLQQQMKIPYYSYFPTPLPYLLLFRRVFKALDLGYQWLTWNSQFALFTTDSHFYRTQSILITRYYGYEKFQAKDLSYFMRRSEFHSKSLTHQYSTKLVPLKNFVILIY